MSQEMDRTASCWHCQAEFDPASSVWCSCSAQSPTKLCPFCLSCCCNAPAAARDAFWEQAPATLRAERDTLRHRRMPLGDMLIASGRITTDQLLAALRLQAESGERLGQCLIRLGVIDESTLRTFLENQFAPMTFDLTGRTIHAALAKQLGAETCMQRRVLPVEMEVLHGRRLVLLAMADPSDLATIDQVQGVLDAHVIPGFVPERVLLDALADLFPAQARGARLTADSPPDLAVRLLEGAARCRADEVRIEVGLPVPRLLYRIDGVLYRNRDVPGGLEESHVEALRRWCEQGVTPARAGREIELADRRLILRPLPATAEDGGGRLTVELLDPEVALAEFPWSELQAAEHDALAAALEATHGLVLMSAPEHAGSARTWWGVVNHLRGRGRRIALVGAPMSHPDSSLLSGAALPPTLIGLGDALDQANIDTLLVHELPRTPMDPGVLARDRLVVLRMVGTRLGETLESWRPPRTERPVVPTLILRQRSVRRICDGCRAPLLAPPDVLRRLGCDPAESATLRPLSGAGCAACSATPGYRGRETLLEIVPTDNRLAELLRRGAPVATLHAALAERALRSFRVTCRERVAQGRTTLDEFQKCGFDRSPAVAARGSA